MLTDSDLDCVGKLFKSRKPFNERGWGVLLIREIRRLQKDVRKAQVSGIKLAADVAKDYDKLSSHGHLVSDCILGKLNVLKGKPRKNKAAVTVEQALSRLEQKVSNLEGTIRFMANSAKRALAQRSFRRRDQEHGLGTRIP